MWGWSSTPAPPRPWPALRQQHASSQACGRREDRGRPGSCGPTGVAFLLHAMGPDVRRRDLLTDLEGSIRLWAAPTEAVTRVTSDTESCTAALPAFRLRLRPAAPAL